MEYKLNTKINRIIYRNPNNNWYTLSIENTLSDKSIFKEVSIIVTGNFENIYEDCSVEISGEYVKHPKYGPQLVCKTYKIVFDTSSKESVISWLTKSTIKGISVQNAVKIYKKFQENTIDVVLNETKKILEVNGIGQKTLEKVLSSVDKYKRIEGLIKYCVDLGFSYNIITKLDNALGMDALDILKDNMYSILDYTDTISFKQLDTVALSNGTDSEDPNRVKYGFLYTLRNRVLFEGSTGCDMQFLKNEVDKELGINDINIFYRALNSLEVEGKVCLDSSKVFLKSFYDVEASISNKIKYLLKYNKPLTLREDIVKEELEDFPFKLNVQQIEAIRNSISNNISIITGAGGCVDEKTEYLTPQGWKKIGDFNEGDLIASYNKDTKNIKFEKPLGYHRYDATTWYEFKNKTSLSQKLSGEHKVPYMASKKVSSFTVSSMEDIFGVFKEQSDFEGRFITNFYSNSKRALRLSDNLLKLFIAVLLKGTITSINKINQYHEIVECKLRLINEEDQVKLEQLLKDCKIEYVYEVNADINNSYKNVCHYKFTLTKNFNSFPESFYALNKKQLYSIYKEIKFWGRVSTKNVVYSTADKKVADFIQYIVTCFGHRSNITLKSKRYIITQSVRNLVRLSRNSGDKGFKTKIVKVEPEKGELKYCFTTSTSFWVARRDDRIFITGNSGKSSILKALANIFARESYDVVLLSPTGKASRRIEECTGRYAQTIHRYIMGLDKKAEKEANNFIFDNFDDEDKSSKSAKISPKTIIMIDEASMLDIIIFNKLLGYLNDDTRIVLIGDTNQLPSVQAGNVLEDLMTYEGINVNILTDVMRQSKNSNIIKYCTRINQGKLVDECNYEDLFYKAFNNEDLLLDYFYRAYDKEIMSSSSDNIQVIMPYKKGELGVNKLNSYIRDNYNDNTLDERYGYKVEDKIMHIKNNYKKGVFNGEVGKVTLINNEEDFLEVTYDTGKIIYETDDIDETMLAYTITCHKSQGSEYPTVFVIIDDSNPLLLYRKLLYTACSRAKQKLYLLAMNNSVEKCIMNNYYKKRITMLGKFLSRKES